MKVIATDIANLTDARYFAAWGVDAMAYNIDSSVENALSPAQLKEIVDWVEGPETMIKIDGLAVLLELSEIDNSVQCHGLIVSPFIETAELSNFESIYTICTLEDGWQDNDKLVLTLPLGLSKISEAQSTKIKALTATKSVLLDADFTAHDLERITQLGFEGIILKGGEEEKVGYKSFDELDEILEAIYD